MSELIETSLSAARLDSGAIAPARNRIDLPALLGAVCERIRSIAPDFSIAVECAALDVTVEGDSNHLAAGQLIYLARNVVHGVAAIEDASVLVTIALRR